MKKKYTIFWKRISWGLMTLTAFFYKSEVCLAQFTPSATVNSIYTRVILKDNILTENDLQALTPADVRAEIQYFDGLGRTIQQVAIQASPDNGKDLVTPAAYDKFGRQDKTYLPFAADGVPGSYRATAITDQATFYATSTASMPAIPNPYSQILFEASPTGRPVETGAPGNAWAIGNGHTIRTGYAFNIANEVRKWDISSSPAGATSSGYYQAGQLFKNSTWDEHRNRVIEYKDKTGLMVCKKVQDGGDTSVPTYMTTYYIYDDHALLTYVVPPALAENLNSFTETDADFARYIYAYHYDQRLRVVEKKVPGKGWEYTVYNFKDLPVLISDAEQRARGAWSFVKYDPLNRIIMTGEDLTAGSQTRVQLQQAVDNAFSPTGPLLPYEQRDNSQPFGYTNVSYPAYNAGSTTVHIVNYYDDYNILTTGANPYPSWFTQPAGSTTETDKTKGLPTVSAINVLGTSNFLYSATYYDKKGRVTKLVKQHQLNGVDITSSTYNFAGETVAVTRQHYKDGSLALTVSSGYQYDNAGRKTQSTEIINSQAPVITTYTYNALGQPETKNVGGQTISYTYNARGWVVRQSSGLFTEELKYEDATSNPQYNGNIAQQLWTTNGQNHSYNYTYDRANRLLSGISDENYNETLSYDKMGNIQGLSRQGLAGIPGLGSLSYNYSGNQLQSVSGGYTRSYSYNENGSMTGDGTLVISYNELNLPKQVTGNAVISYEYDAEGNKLKKQTNTETRYYIDDIEYIINSTNPLPIIDLLHTEEGIARNNSGNYTYEYFHSDHLGNTRLVFNSAGIVKQQTDYYPFGLEINRLTSGTKIRYLFNGIEKNDELNTYEAFFRQLDPVVGRWWMVDPRPTYPESPYVEMGNNPLYNTDFWGDTMINGQAYENLKNGEYLPEVFVSSSRTKPQTTANLTVGAAAIGLGLSSGTGSAFTGGTVVAAAPELAVLLPVVVVTAAIVYPFSGERTVSVRPLPIGMFSSDNTYNYRRPNIVPPPPLPVQLNAGRGKNDLEPDPEAEGAHSTYKRDKNGEITNTATWTPNPLNPSGYDIKKRVDVKGRPHFDKKTQRSIPTPHVQEGKNVRAATKEDLPIK
ncbi:MAG: hypothetical protein J7599_07330 [Niabella sp.]|nr:hypothetical protein [Niabella sp.]